MDKSTTWSLNIIAARKTHECVALVLLSPGVFYQTKYMLVFVPIR